ncbi:hypothetical protein M5K25_009071 [Dendrobium thyrsiflorum]|uniref:SWIM-type domain-containing protein n=1 Tax=Dendrobium thyrsiflorum TaxID=117978 RepID=A0ABD0V4J6_DENTH
MADELRGRLSLCERPTFLQQYDRPRASVSEHRHEPTLLSEFNEQSHSFRPYVQVDSVQEPHHVAYSAEIEDDFNEYQTMDSASTRSSGSGTEFDIPNPSMEDNETEVPGHECLKQHAKNNDEGLEAMFCSNEFIENVTTAKEWDQNASYDAPVVENVVTLTESTHSTELHEGLIFHTKEALQCAINAWSIANNVQYKNLCSNKNRLTITCAHHDNPQRPCAWRLHAARSKRLGGLWRISDCGPQHTCTHAVTMQGHRNCTSKFVCTFITPIVRQQLDIKPREIIARIESKFDIKLSYVKAWDARRKAIQAIFGTYEESYRSLYRFIEATRIAIPGTVYNIQVVGNSRFKSIFWAFGVSITGWQYCRPVLTLDGTFLLGKYRGTLLAAIGLDGNGGLFPLAFAVVESESNESWTWFLQMLHDLIPVVRERPFLCIVSDKHPGLVRGCREVFPNVAHRHCLRHLRENFKKAVRRLGVQDSEGLAIKMYNAGNTDDTNYFNHMMNDIRMTKQEAYDWLVQRDVEKWTLIFDGGHRFGVMTTNASECFNGVLKRARGLPIQGLIMAIYYNIVAVFNKRSAEALNLIEQAESDFVPRTRIIIQRFEREARRYPIPIMINSREFQVFDMSTRAQKVEVTETNAFTCTCSKPQLYHIPCAHVIATSRIRHWDYNTLISPYYTLQFYKDSYAEVFHTIPDKDQWPSFTNDHGIIPLIAPAFRRRVGRPRSNRIRTTMDEASNASVRACGFCKNLGHNRATCPNNPGSSR